MKIETPFMAVKEYLYIKNIIEKYKFKNILEWGSGASTLWFSKIDHVKKWVAIEHNPEYYNYLLSKINDKVDLRLLQGDDYINVKGKYDLIIIDGILRKECLQKAFKMLSSHPQALILLHDSGRLAYKEWFNKYPHENIFDGEGWLGDGWDHRGLTKFKNE